jgi:hypothetical protein
VSHFRPFVKIDVFYWTPSTFRPTPWFKMSAKVFVDRDGLVQSVLAESQSLEFPAPDSGAAPEVPIEQATGVRLVGGRLGGRPARWPDNGLQQSAARAIMKPPRLKPARHPPMA